VLPLGATLSKELANHDTIKTPIYLFSLHNNPGGVFTGQVVF
jgi:hypothetical protein